MNKMNKRWINIPLVLAVLTPMNPVSAQDTRFMYNPDWSIPAEPVQIADQLYQVGTATLTSFLITSDEGHILIDVPLNENVDLVLANVHKLGFDPSDVEILLGSQAHYDHVGGFASMMEATGAELVLSELDGELVASGGRGDFFLGDRGMFRPARASRTVSHLETVTIGDRTLTAHLTPGHTKGCTTWSGEFTIDGEPERFVSICSLTAHPGYRLVGSDPSYPGIARDFCRSIAYLRGLSADIFASTHTAWFNLEEKTKAFQAGDRRAFVDPEGYVAFIDDSERAIAQKLTEEGEPGGCEAVLAREASVF